MQITQGNSTNPYSKQANPKFGMALKFTKGAAEILEQNLAHLPSQKQAEILKRIELVALRQEQNPVDIIVKKEGMGFSSTVNDLKIDEPWYAFLQSGFWYGHKPGFILETDVKTIEKAEQYANKLCTNINPENKTRLENLLKGRMLETIKVKSSN